MAETSLRRSWAGGTHLQSASKTTSKVRWPTTTNTDHPTPTTNASRHFIDGITIPRMMIRFANRKTSSGGMLTSTVAAMK